MPRETHTFRHVDRGTLTRVDPGQFGAVGGRDRRADRTVALSYTDAETQTACWEERSQVCGEIRLALAEVRRRTPSAGLRGTPGGRRQCPSSVGPRQALLLLLLHTTPHHTTPHHTTPHHTTPHHTTPHHTPPYRGSNRGAPCAGAPGICAPCTPLDIGSAPPPPGLWRSTETAAASR